MKKHASLLVLTLFTVSAAVPYQAPSAGGRHELSRLSPQEKRDATIVARCRAWIPGRLDEYQRYLKDLSVKRDFETLAVIYAADFPFSSWAARECALAQGPVAVVSFCSQFKPGSANWEAAFFALGSYNKSVSIGYVAQMARNADPFVRCCCYKLCLANGWSGLAECARKDVDNNSAYLLPNQEPMVTGDLAKEYLEVFGDSQQDILRPSVTVSFLGDKERALPGQRDDLVITLLPNSALYVSGRGVLDETDLDNLLSSVQGDEVHVRLIVSDEASISAPAIFEAVSVLRRHACATKKTWLIAPFKMEGK